MLSFEVLEVRSLLSISSPLALLPLASSGSAAQPAAAGAPITSVRDGLWSNPATWGGGRVPGPADDAVIANNVTIDQAQVHELDINAGTATLAGDLQAYASVVVRSRLVGTEGGIYFHVTNDRLFTGNTQAGPDATEPDFHPEDTGLWALRGATINLQGDAVSSWLDAIGTGPVQDLGNGVTQHVSFGGGQATLASAPTGWKVGDTLLLVNEHGQSALADLVAVNGGAIQYHQRKVQATDPDLVGHTLVTSGSNLVVNSKVADLTRRIRIVGADVRQGDVNHRAQTAFLDGATVNLANVEFRDLGARGKLGRYPVYFDGGGAVSSSLTGSSIWQDVTDAGNRFVALRSVRGVTVSNNVAFRAQGDGFFLEDGGDFGDSIVNNLSVQVTGGEELPNADSEATDLTHHYWLRAGNTISDNVAAGGDAVGMIVLAGSGPSTAVVSNAQVLGAGLYGMWTATPDVTFNNPVAVFNSRAGFASDPAWDIDSHGATLNNPLLLFNGTSDSAYGSQVFMNDSGLIAINGGVLAGNKAFHTHYHSAFSATNVKINVNTLLVPTYWEQAATLDHDQIQASLFFERAYPAPRYSSPGVVRITNTNLTLGNEAPEIENADYIGNTFQNYPALQGTPVPNAIELSQLAPASGFIRVTMLSDADRWMTNIARWTVTPIGQARTADTFIYQRQTAWTKLSSLGGYPDGFPPGQYAVNLYTEDGVLLKSGFAVVRSGQVSDLTDTLSNSPGVVGRSLFYNQSKFDGNSAAANASDDLAIATDKQAYLPGSGAASFANVSSYTRGINGLMVDLLSTHGGLTANDFIFKTGNNNSPSGWTTVPTTATITTRAGAGVGGSDRVEITFPDHAVQNRWLEVIVKGNDTLGGSDANTGLAASDVFFWGNAVGDSGSSPDDNLAFVTDATDELAARNNTSTLLRNILIANIYDYNRDGQVTVVDQLASRNNADTTLTALQAIDIAAAGPLASVAGLPATPGVALVSSAASASASPAASSDSVGGLASGLSLADNLPLGLAPWLQSRLQNDLDSPPLVTILHTLEQRGTPVSRQILQAIDKIADKYNLHDDVLDGILLDLGLQ